MAQPKPDDLAERANRAYWETNEGVNHIADALDASKSALYGMIEPLATGETCAVCAGALVWENRTARDKHVATCPTCEAGGGAVEASVRRTSGAPVTRTAPSGTTTTAPTPLSLSGTTPTFDQARALGGAVLVGLGAGFLAAVLMLRRR